MTRHSAILGIYLSGLAFAAAMTAPILIVSHFGLDAPPWLIPFWWVWAIANAHGRAYEHGAATSSTPPERRPDAEATEK